METAIGVFSEQAPINVKKTLADIETAAKAKAKPDAVVYETMAIGEYHRQGDVYLQRIDPSEFDRVHFSQTVAMGSFQLAPGETQGSRHIIPARDMKHIELCGKPNATALDGPMIKAKKAFTVEHPEHGAVTLPAGTYAVTYQRQLAQELRRVAD